MLEELAGKARVGAEQQRPLATDDAGVQMGHRHRRRALGGLSIDLGVMTRAYLVDVATQPDTADREPGIAVCFRDPRFLQEFQPAAAGADEHELGRYGPRVFGLKVLHRDLPAAVSELV